MKIEHVVPELVDVPKRLRSLEPDKIKQLAESIDALGLQQPITVWSKGDGHLELVAGAHRLAAVISLGWDKIDCIFADFMTDIDRHLWEIDENLIRAELSPSEHADHLARREELWEAQQFQVVQVDPPEKSVGYKSPPKQEKGFAADTAKKTGMSKTTINRATSRAKAIPADIRAIIKYTKLDTGTYLDSLKGMEPDDQREKVKADLAEPSVQQDAEIRTFNRACAARGKALCDVKLTWRRASAEDRRRIKAWILEQETPASDNDDRATEIPEGAS